MSEQPINDILSQLKKTEQTLPIYIPSLKQTIDFKPITLKQQKNVMDKVTTNSFGLIEFFNTIYELIASSSTVDAKQFNVIDRFNILLSFRNYINQTYENVSLPLLLEKNKNVALPPASITVRTDKFVFELSIPNLFTDYRCNSYIISTFKDEKELLGKLMVNELSKFINKITILNEKETVIDMDAQTIKNKFTILETIDTKQLAETFAYISKVRDTEQELVKYEDTQIDIGPELFIL
jgi:hypothetical protein